MSKAPRYLLDVNVFVALTSTTHVHHQLVKEWFNASPSLQWSLCAFTEGGFLRMATAPREGSLTIDEATTVLNQLTKHPGYRYQPISADWQTLSAPVAKRLHGHNQVTDAYLLGLAIHEGLVLATLDKGILHMAGDHRDHVLLLRATQTQ